MFTKPVALTWFVACLAATSFTTAAATAQQGTEFTGVPAELSASMGGRQHFELVAGQQNAGRWYISLGSLSGAHPGTVVGDFLIPLNYDIYTERTLFRPNAGAISNQLARLDGAGNAMAQLFLPANVAIPLVGTTVHHAYVVFNEDSGIAAVSEPVPLLLEG